MWQFVSIGMLLEECSCVDLLLFGIVKTQFGKQLYKLFVFKIRSLKMSIHKFFSFTLK